MANSFDLTGKIALVTGGSRGIGKVIAETLARAGAAVAISYRERAHMAQEVVRGIEAEGGHSLAVEMDVVDRTAVCAALAAVVAAWGGLDILVNNAGIIKPADFDAITDAEWDEVLSVNLKGPFICCQEALPVLRSRGGGSIVNIGSVSGQYGGPRTAHYAASKAGLISLGQVVARFGAADGIRCNTVAPGLIESEMASAGLQAVAVQNVATNVLLGRLGTAEEVAQAVLFLAADASRYVTAQTINVNGGLYF